MTTSRPSIAQPIPIDVAALRERLRKGLRSIIAAREIGDHWRVSIADAEFSVLSREVWREDNIRSLLDAMDELATALEPFAAFAHREIRKHISDDKVLLLHDIDDPLICLTAGDLRRARAALAKVRG